MFTLSGGKAHDYVYPGPLGLILDDLLDDISFAQQAEVTEFSGRLGNITLTVTGEDVFDGQRATTDGNASCILSGNTGIDAMGEFTVMVLMESLDGTNSDPAVGLVRGDSNGHQRSLGATASGNLRALGGNNATALTGVGWPTVAVMKQDESGLYVMDGLDASTKSTATVDTDSGDTRLAFGAWGRSAVTAFTANHFYRCLLFTSALSDDIIELNANALLNARQDLQ